MNDEPQIRTRSAAERECDQLRALLRGVWEIVRVAPSTSSHRARDLISASGLLDDEGQQR